MELRLIALALLGLVFGPAVASDQPSQPAELQVPVGQIEAFCDEFRQAMDGCFAAKGVPAASGRHLTGAQIVMFSARPILVPGFAFARIACTARP